MRKRFDPFPELRTKSLILRKMRMNDVQDLFEMRRDPRSNRYVDNLIDRSLSETIDYLEKMNQGIDAGKWIIWGLEHKLEVRLIGTISIWNFNKSQSRAELGYGLDFSYQHQGYMSEALRVVVAYAFQSLELKTLLAYTEIRNQPSINLLERLNFKKIDQIQEEGILTNRTYQMAIYHLEKNK